MIHGHATGTDLLEVPTIYKAYFSGLNFREYPQNSYGQKNMVRLRSSILGSWNSHLGKLSWFTNLESCGHLGMTSLIYNHDSRFQENRVFVGDEIYPDLWTKYPHDVCWIIGLSPMGWPRCGPRSPAPPSWVASVGGRGPDAVTPTPPVLFSASNKLDLPATHGEGLWHYGISKRFNWSCCLTPMFKRAILQTNEAWPVKKHVTLRSSNFGIL